MGSWFNLMHLCFEKGVAGPSTHQLCAALQLYCAHDQGWGCILTHVMIDGNLKRPFNPRKCYVICSNLKRSIDKYMISAELLPSQSPSVAKMNFAPKPQTMFQDVLKHLQDLLLPH